MPLTPQQQSQIITAFNQRIGGYTRPCAVCGATQYTLADGFLWFQLKSSLPALQLGGPGIPCVAIVCNNCGNTLFLNLITLGLQHLAGA